MPTAPRYFCPLHPNNPDCSGFEAHARAKRNDLDQTRPSARQRLYTTKWDIARGAFLHAHPLCAHVHEHESGIVEAATLVDHIIPHRGDYWMFWDSDNWQPLCSYAHARKTARENRLMACEHHGRVDSTKRIRGAVICIYCGQGVMVPS